MFRKYNRLLTPLPQRASTQHSRLCTLKYVPNSHDHSRFGFVVGKRVSKSAVVRNRTKRIFRSVLENQTQKIRSGYDMLFIIQQPLTDSDGVEHEITTLLEKAELWV